MKHNTSTIILFTNKSSLKEGKRWLVDEIDQLKIDFSVIIYIYESIPENIDDECKLLNLKSIKSHKRFVFKNFTIT